MHKLIRWVLPIVVVAIFTAAVMALRHELQHYHLSDFRKSFEDIAGWRLWCAAGLTALNYAILAGYDLLALRAIGENLSVRRTALASFVGYTSSYNFGALLGGTSVRYRMYSTWGLSAVQIVRILALLGIAFWAGLCAIAGLVFLTETVELPASLHVPFTRLGPLGAILLSMPILYLILAAVLKQPLRIRHWEFALPRFRIAAAQLLVASADLLVAASVLYVLIEPAIEQNYWQFLAIYLFAVVAVLFTHVPGGLGVFELVILTMVKTDSQQAIVGGLIALRAIYYLGPLLIAAVLMAIHELRLQRQATGQVATVIGRGLSVLTPWVIALATFAAGAVLLISGAIPGLPGYLQALDRFIPFQLIELSHFLGSIVGAALLLLARGLQRRLDSAWWMAAVLLAAGILFSLLKGWDYEEALLLSVILAAHIACRKQFYRRGALLHESFSPGWIAAIVVTVGASIWLGMFAYKHVDYSDSLWWNFTLRADAPRFMRGTVGALSLLLIFGIAKLLTPNRRSAEPGLSNPETMSLVKTILTTSRQASNNLALLGDKRFLFNETRTSFVMYGVQGRSWIAMGDPVGPLSDRAEMVWQFRELCDRYDARPVFYQVEPEGLPMYLDAGLSLQKLGEEARVPLADFSLDGSRRQKLRQTVRKIEREGCSFEVIPVEQVPSVIDRLQVISDAWMAEKKAVEKGFSLGFFSPEYVSQFPCALIRRGEEIIAFANIWLPGGKEECSIDLMRYIPGSPAGVMEYLFVQMILWGREQGYAYFNIGMAPLAGIQARPLAPLWNKAADLLFRHGDHFYSFEGLRHYKNKFDPIWTPKYLACPGGLALPRVLADVTTLIGKKSSPAKSSASKVTPPMSEPPTLSTSEASY